jgi:hypothetical protein
MTKLVKTRAGTKVPRKLNEREQRRRAEKLRKVGTHKRNARHG